MIRKDKYSFTLKKSGANDHQTYHLINIQNSLFQTFRISLVSNKLTAQKR